MPWNWDLDLKLSNSMEPVYKTIKLSRPLELVKSPLITKFEMKSLLVDRVIKDTSWAWTPKTFTAKNEQCGLKALYLHNNLK